MKPFLDKAYFKKHAEKLFLEANPTAVVQGWIKQPRMIKFPTGKWAQIGEFYAIAEGFKPSIVKADYDDELGWWIKP